MGDFDPRGVNARLVRKVREALDAEGFEACRIVVSGGFTVEKIRAFEDAGVPADVYGVGSSLLRGSNDFTADIVRVDGGRRRRSAAASGRTPARSLVTLRPPVGSVDGRDRLRRRDARPDEAIRRAATVVAESTCASRAASRSATSGRTARARRR